MIGKDVSPVHKVVRVWGPDKVGLLSQLSELGMECGVDCRDGVAHTFGDQAVIFIHVMAPESALADFEAELVRALEKDKLSVSFESVNPCIEPDMQALPWLIQVTTVDKRGVLALLSKFIAKRELTIISWHGEPYTPPRAVGLGATVQSFTVLLPQHIKHSQLEADLNALRENDGDVLSAVLSTRMNPL